MHLRVITVTRGDSPHWPAAASSLLAAAPSAEHIVIAPASKLPKVLDSAPGAKGVPEIAAGLYANLNHGLAAPGDWDAFTWLNDDDLLLSPGFERAVAMHVTNPKVDVTYGRVVLIDGAGRRVGQIPIAHRPDDLGALWRSGIVPFAQPGTVIGRRAVRRIGLFDLSYRIAADADFFIRAVHAQCRFAYVSDPVAAFRLTAGQLSKHTSEVQLETARAIATLTGHAARAARWRFRFGNLSVYLERIRRHGWKSMRQIYDSTQ